MKQLQIIKKIRVFTERKLKFIYGFIVRFLSFVKTTFFSKKESEKQVQQAQMDKKLVYSLSKSRIPNFRQLKYIKKFLKPRELWAIRLSSLVIAITVIIWGGYFYFSHLEVTPVRGGLYTEALVGSPKYINPLYSSVSDVDNDISKLVYSSLYTRGKNGELVYDLAENLEILSDGKIYKIKIREGVKWHNDDFLTVDDIVFTYNAIIDLSYKSNLRNSFLGVKIEKLDDYNFQFILREPYAAFLELLTFGILPSKLWIQIQPETAQLAELNIKPIGSGMYKFKELKKDKSGNIKEYELEVNEEYYRNKPFVDIKFKFFSIFEETIEALNLKQVDGVSYLPQGTKENILTPNSYNFQRLYLPQMTLLFINQEKNEALKDKAVRQALALALDRNKIVNNYLDGDAYVVYGPILSNSFAYNSDIKKYEYDEAEAIKLLDQVDWKIASVTEEQVTKAHEDINSEDEKLRDAAQKTILMGTGDWRKKNDNFLIIELKTVARSENENVINVIKEYWERIGVKVVVEVVPISEIQASTIKPRNFDILFYGQVVGSDPDPYVFWHSSQTGENGFNIANFSNKEVDELLEDARLDSDQDKRKELYKKFQNIIAEEVPAIFMYSPVYIYTQNNDLQGFEVSNILSPSDRFSNIEDWYLKTGKRLVLE